MSDPLLEQLRIVQQQRQQNRRIHYNRSRLDRYRAEIEKLIHHGASHRDIVTWLRHYKRVKVHSTTVGRVLKRWQEKDAWRAAQRVAFFAD